MKRRYPILLAASGVLLAFGACGGRNLEDNVIIVTVTEEGPAGAGGSVGQGGDGVGGEAVGGAGVGGEGGQGPGSGGIGGQPPNPIDCLTCVGIECPAALDCVTNPDCINGLVCAVGQCLGGGAPDLPCLLDCFNGDIDAALAAVEVITCVLGTCGDECGGLLPFP